MKDVTTIGIDLAKTVFQVHGTDKRGNKVFSKAIRRSKLIEFMANKPCCLIGMEACGGSNYWARTFSALGHEVKLIAPQFVKPYVMGNKNDVNDAEAISEAITRPRARFVSVKTIGQQDIQAIHRIRKRLVSNRTQLTNQIRGLLHEYGLVIAKGKAALILSLPKIIGDEINELSYMMRVEFQQLFTEFLDLNKKIETLALKISKYAHEDDRCRRLLTIPGIGPLTATTFLTTVGGGEVFSKARQVSAYLGLVPKQNSSGGKAKLLGISKRGDKYLRELLVHGARSYVRTVINKSDPYANWIKRLIDRIGMNKAVVAVANKNARMAWALLRDGSTFSLSKTSKFELDQVVTVA